MPGRADFARREDRGDGLRCGGMKPSTQDSAVSEVPDAGARRRGWELITLVAMYLGYAAFMLCRNTLIASSAAMINDPTLGLDKEKFGRLMSWHSAGAIGGKLVTGVGADWMGGRRMFLLALALVAAATAVNGMVSTLLLFGVLNFTGQFFKAGGWPAMAKIIGVWYPRKSYGRVWSLLSTSSRVGTMAAGILLGYLLTRISWRAVFMVSAGVTLLIVVGVAHWLREDPADVGLPPPREDDGQDDGPRPPHPLDGTSLWEACGDFVTSGRVWLICLSLSCLCIMMDFLNFIPIYLNEALGIDPGHASMAGSSFPAGMFLALLVTSAVYDGLSKQQLVRVLGGLLGLACLCVLGLWNLGGLPLPPEARVPAAMALLFVFGFALSPAYYVPMSVFGIAYGGPHSGFLIALIDVFGYAGALVFNYFGGSLAQQYGWSTFLGVLLSITVAAMVTMVGFLHLDHRASAEAAPA